MRDVPSGFDDSLLDKVHSGPVLTTRYSRAWVGTLDT